MTFKTLLTHAEPDWGAGDALTGAKSVAAVFGSHIVGVAAQSFKPADYAFVDGQLVQQLRDQIDTDLQTAKARFEAAMADHESGSTFVSQMEAPGAVMARMARGCDLVVARRTPSGASSTNLCHPADLVMETGAPVLLVPDEPRAFDSRRVVVAWKDCREARRALADALPILRRAEQVHLLTVRDPAARPPQQAELGDVVDRLGRHGVSATVEIRDPAGVGAPAAISRAADELDAGVIVAGAYSHSRLREWVLGGVTQWLMDGSPRYVLLSR